MDENETLLEQMVELKVQERINIALVDTILDNIQICKYSSDKLEFTDRGVKELMVILKNFYFDEYNERIRELRSKEEVNNE